MLYNTISASIEQQNKLWKKHVRFIPKRLFEFLRKSVLHGIINSKFSYDSEDHIGFVTLYTVTGKTISYQLRGDYPCFFRFTGFGNICYDVAYMEKSHPEMYKFLKEMGISVRNKFWKGSHI